MSASKVERTASKRQRLANWDDMMDVKLQCMKHMFYLCCSGVRHDVTYGHSHTVCEDNSRCCHIRVHLKHERAICKYYLKR